MKHLALNKINILGTEYTLIQSDENQDPYLKNADGYCDQTVHECVISTFYPEPMSVKDLEEYKKKVIRHELVHAFLFESGLAEESWAKHEEIVDWIAFQFPKMLKAFQDAEAI